MGSPSPPRPIVISCAKRARRRDPRNSAAISIPATWRTCASAAARFGMRFWPPNSRRTWSRRSSRPTMTGYAALTLHPVDVAVRSSATAEDLARRQLRRPAGDLSQRAGPSRAAGHLQACFASLFTDRAISYRADKGFDHFKIALSIGVQRMVRSDLAACRGDVHHRHRNRFPRRRADQRRLRPGRKHRPGIGQSRRILRLQANAEGRASGRSCRRYSAPRNSSSSMTSAAGRW